MAVAASTTVTTRIPTSSYDWLDEEARRLNVPVELLAGQLIEEAIRMSRIPGIYFVGNVPERRARLMGGMDVWEMIMIYRDHGRVGLLEAYDFPEVHVDRALAYYDAFPDEIDEILEENSRPPEYWLAKYPELNMQIHRV